MKLSTLNGLAVAAAALASLSVTAASAPVPETDVRRDATVEAVQKVMPCVVNVATEEVVPIRDPMENLFREFFDPYYRRRPPNTQYSLGSGVIIDEEGYVLTNFHVVSRASRVWVRLADGREYEAERIVGTTYTDVALLKIKGKKEEKFRAVKFAADDDLLLGETVLALGNPFGLGGSVSRGILSSKSRRPPTENEPLDVLDWLQTDASINPGNSGGPLVNLRGELIGISVAIYREGQGIGFAIPIKRISAAISEIYSPEILESLWFGARVKPGASALTVMAVQVESPAGKAGLRAGDHITQVDGKVPSGFIEFNRLLLDGAKEDRDIRLTILRGSDRRTMTLRLVPEKTFFNADLIRKKTGAQLQEMTRELAQSMGFSRAEGLLIAGVDKGSAGAAAELQRGMLITTIDGQATSDLITAAKKLYGKTKGDKVQLAVVWPRQRGAFIEYRQGTVEVTVR
ncbi:MAG TPA: trypsin-like peptidase domain-containing protein [Verrucomicrobiae bacterium]